jgi:hypothetical protein
MQICITTTLERQTLNNQMGDFTHVCLHINLQSHKYLPSLKKEFSMQKLTNLHTKKPMHKISVPVYNETNLMHYLSSVYSVTISVHGLCLLVPHNKDVTMHVCDNWYVLYVLVKCRHALIELKPMVPIHPGLPYITCIYRDARTKHKISVPVGKLSCLT